jgi:hypothetical protein
MNSYRGVGWLGAGLVAIVVAILILLQFLAYLHKGTIIISSSAPHNTITLTKVASDDDDDDESAPQTFTGHNSLSETVGLGRYVASVQGNSVATTQIIDLKSHETLRYIINPITTTSMAPVAYQSAQNLVTNDSSLVYLDTTTRQIDEISNNTITVLSPNNSFQSVKWANVSFGVAQDTSGHLFLIQNGSVSPLTVPQIYYPNIPVGYAVAPDEQIYVSFGATVYVGNGGGNFKELYTAKTSAIGLIAGPSQVIVSESISEAGKVQQDEVEVSDSGKVANKDFDLGTVVWSPNGQYLASSNEDGGVLYNNATGDSSPIPDVSLTSFINGMVWLNNTTLLFSNGGQVWAYNIANQKSQLIANTPLDVSATELSLNSSHTYLYILTGNSSGNTAIRRVGLAGQSIPNYIYQLQDILPDRLDNYSLSLINLTGTPVVLVQPYPDAPPANYIQTATTQLQSLGFNTSQFSMQLTSTIPGE